MRQQRLGVPSAMMRPASQHDDAVGAAQRLQHVVRDHHRGEPQRRRAGGGSPGPSASRVSGSSAEKGSSISTISRFGSQRAGDADALAFSARQLAGEARAIIRIEPHEAEQLVDAGTDAPCLPAKQLRRDRDVLRHRHVREEPDLLKHVADPAAQLDRIERSRVDAADGDPPAVGSERRLISCRSVVFPEPDAPTTR